MNGVIAILGLAVLLWLVGHLIDEVRRHVRTWEIKRGQQAASEEGILRR